MRKALLSFLCLSIIAVAGQAQENTAVNSAVLPAPRDVRKELVLELQRRLREINRARIIGGQTATDGQFPWQVALITAGYQPSDGQFCGGTLIEPNWIVTAAHCVAFGTRPQDIEVFTGSVDLRSGGQQYAVAEIFSHERFDSVTFDNDIALLRLTTPVTTGGSISVIRTTEETSLLPVGRQLRVSGWGRTAEGGATSKLLRFVGVPLVDRIVCNEKDSYGGAITTNMICAGYETGGADSCQGDSGGPLVAPDGPSFRLAGVVSWGDGCAQPKKYGVYTRASNYVTWISSKMAPAAARTEEWRLHVEWAIANTDAGSSTDCASQYPLPGCVLSGGRSCLMQEAITLAKAGKCQEAVALTLVTQCHNSQAAQVVAANSAAVCAYLRTK
jgi:secreted trypsin-like serine protease